MELSRNGVLEIAGAALLRPWLRWLDRPSLPRFRGTVVCAAIRKPVNVRWDEFAVPHVFAANEVDLFFAQGFLHAQERLWQMELSRRFLSGRTSEIFGNLPLPWQDLSVQFRRHTSVDLDYFMRLLGIRGAAAASLDLVPEELRLRLEAYCAGINHYIDRCGKKLPWEFRLLRHRPEPWRAEDPLTIGKGLALLLSTALYSRLNFFAIANRLKHQPEKLQALFPGDPPDAPAIVRAIWDPASSAWRFLHGILQSTNWHPAGNGSNSWVVAPNRSQCGAATLCNDPHLRMSLPSLWYLMHMQSAEPASELGSYEVWGASIPGCPLIQIGRNRAIAWGITAAVCDDVEIYRERVHRIDPQLYEFANRWQRFETRQELLGIRSAAPLSRLVRHTRHGPVISDFDEAIGARQEVFSVRWTAREASEELRSLYGVNLARDWPQFLDSLSLHGAPTLNFTYADCAGNIGYALAGKVPLRKRAPTLEPLPGWHHDNDWVGYIPFAELPRILNPPEGWIGSANNRIADGAYPYYLSRFFEPSHRYRRIAQILGTRERHSIGDLAAMQLDDLSLHARELIATLKSDLESAAAGYADLADAVRELLSWNGRCSIDSSAAALFHVFHHRLLFNLLVPDLGEDFFPAYVEILNQCIAPTDAILANPESPWFALRSRRELVAVALREARDELTRAFGGELSAWTWGRFHTLTLNHSLSRVPILKKILSIGPLPAPGDGMTLNLGFYRHSNPYRQTVGSSLRFIAVMSDPPTADFILPSGQSGHIGSVHFRDQNVLWRDGRRLRLIRSDFFSAGTRDELVLEPVGPACAELRR